MSGAAGAAAGLLLAALSMAACDARAPAPERGDRTITAAGPSAALPPGAEACVDCHARVVEQYAGHGMADAAGPVTDPPQGAILNPASGTLYTWRTVPAASAAEAGGVFLDLRRRDGAVRSAAVVGRLGAGRHDVAFVGAAVDPIGRQTERLIFLPVEQHPDGRLVLAPFEEHGDTGFGMPAPGECLQCHATTDVTRLPAAATGPDRRHVFPVAHLGADFTPLRGLSCDACHGATNRHVELMRAAPRPAERAADIGLVRLSDLPGPALRDVCARCHLDGEVRVELGRPLPYGPQEAPLHGLRPVVVPADGTAPHRFAGQVERLVQSPCFQGAPQMSCNTCHDAHAAPRAQGIEAFDRRCLDCHARPGDVPRDGHAAGCSRPAGATVETALGRPARGPQGCTDCHMSDRQPLDLSGVASTDHLVRRFPPPREAPRPARFLADRDGAVAVFDDGRLAAALASPAGRLWEDGVSAAWLFRAGRIEEAALRLDRFPPPGSDAARQPAAPPGLTPLQTSATFHHLRGLVLAAAGRTAEAELAFGDALWLDPLHPEALAQRGSVRLALGDTDGALSDAQALRAAYPRAEAGPNLAARALALRGELPEAAAALAASTEAWALDAGSWHELGRLLLMTGRRHDAATALELAAWLDPTRPGLAELREGRGR